MSDIDIIVDDENEGTAAVATGSVGKFKEGNCKLIIDTSSRSTCQAQSLHLSDFSRHSSFADEDDKKMTGGNKEDVNEEEDDDDKNLSDIQPLIPDAMVRKFVSYQSVAVFAISSDVSLQRILFRSLSRNYVRQASLLRSASTDSRNMVRLSNSVHNFVIVSLTTFSRCHV